MSVIRAESPLPVRARLVGRGANRDNAGTHSKNEEIFYATYISEHFSSISKACVAFDVAIVSYSRKQATAGAGRISTIRPVEPGKVAAMSRAQHTGRVLSGPDRFLFRPDSLSEFCLNAGRNPTGSHSISALCGPLACQ